MSKELIEKLREKADSLTTTVGVMNLLHEAADALEAKAAPVGERDDERAAIHQLAFELGGTEGGEYLLDADDLDAVIDAAYQRQSGVVIPPNPYKPELSDADLTDYEKGELQGRCDMWSEFARLNGGRSHE